MSETRVAIACQGGGSHTAFTAGVLAGLLAEWPDDHRIVGLSGASGGAMNALLAWYGLLTDGEGRSIDLLESFWNDIAAETAADRAFNDWTVFTSRLRTSGLPAPAFSPYLVPATGLAQSELRDTLERHVEFDRLPDLVGGDCPRLVVGTVDVNGGEFETFVDDEVTADALLASAAVPDLFPAVEINGHWHWDGLFSQNPPIGDLMDGPPERKPEELWIVQINPQTRDGEPRSLDEIADRRNELSGNISLNQELRFVERVNDWIEEGHLPADEFTHTSIHRLELGRELHCSTKVDRSPAFIQELIDAGRDRARAFLDGR